MRKKITLLALVLCLCCPATAFASDSNVGQAPEEEAVGVYGKSQTSKDYYEITLGDGGMDRTELPGNIVLSGKSDSSKDNGLVVVIIPVTEKDDAEAYAWASGNTTALGEEPVIYYLAGYYKNQPKEPDGTVTITVTQKEGYEEADLYFMDGETNPEKAVYTVDSGKISFTMEDDGYYLLVKPEKQDETEDETIDESESETESDDETESETEDETEGETEDDKKNDGIIDDGKNDGTNNGGNANGGTNAGGSNGNVSGFFGVLEPKTGDSFALKLVLGVLAASAAVVVLVGFKLKKTRK